MSRLKCNRKRLFFICDSVGAVNVDVSGGGLDQRDQNQPRRGSDPFVQHRTDPERQVWVKKKMYNYKDSFVKFIFFVIFYEVVS